MNKARFHGNAPAGGFSHAGNVPMPRTPADNASADAGKPRVLEGRRFGELAFVSRAWAAIVPDAVPYADILKPAFWKLSARRMSARDTIDVVNDAFTFYAKLLVVSADAGTDTVEVRELYRREFDPPRVAGQEINGFAVAWNGAFDKWTVARASDGHVMRRHIASREEARHFVLTELTPRLAAGRAS